MNHKYQYRLEAELNLVFDNATRPADSLLGLSLEGGWRVIEKLENMAGATGGYFSSGYVVERASGQTAFMKATDFHDANQKENAMLFIHALTEAFLFEVMVLERCKSFDRVVSSIGSGKTHVGDLGVSSLVHYIIFEKATGDVRRYSAFTNNFECAYALRALHHIATGLKQLHSGGIAHQDIKPSNVLVFENKINKLADLGRSTAKGEVGPNDHYHIAGDRSYAPPEQLYGHLNSEWVFRRLGCDAYQLGSMIVYFFAGFSMTDLIHTNLDESHRWDTWTNSYSEVLPYVREAFDRAVEAVSAQVPGECRADIVEVVNQLCEPDPDLRGHPRNRRISGQAFQLDRYVSRFDLLATAAENRLRR